MKRGQRLGIPVEDAAPKRAAVPSVQEAANTLTERMVRGDIRARGGHPYSPATIENYAGVLTRHVLPFHVERYGCDLGALTADLVDQRMIEDMAHSLAAAGERAAKRRAKAARKRAEAAGKDPARVREGIGTGTARLAVAALRQVLADLYRRGLLDAVPPAPVNMPKPPEPRSRRIEMDDAARLVAAAVEDDARLGRSMLGPFVMLASRTGARRNELRCLRWGEGGVMIGKDGATVTIARSTTKTDAGARTLALDPETAAMLRAHRMATGRPADGQPVFPNPKDPRQPIGVNLIRAGFARIGKATGIEDPGTHLLRHSVGSWAGDAGVPVIEVAARLGHVDPAHTQRTYQHANLDRIAREPLALEWPAGAKG
jgi:integrase